MSCQSTHSFSLLPTIPFILCPLVQIGKITVQLASNLQLCDQHCPAYHPFCYQIVITAGMKAAVDFRGKLCLCQRNQIDMTMSVNPSSLRIFCLFIVQSGRRNGEGIAALFLSLFRRGLSPCPQQTADLDHTGLFIWLNSVRDQRYQKCP